MSDADSYHRDGDTNEIIILIQKASFEQHETEI